MSHSIRRIAILTGGGDVPGLNPAIRAVTIRATREGYRVLGIRRGWGGLVDLVPEAGADNSACVIELSEALVNRVGRTGGTFLHTSRTRASHLPKASLNAFTARTNFFMVPILSLSLTDGPAAAKSLTRRGDPPLLNLIFIF